MINFDPVIKAAECAAIIDLGNAKVAKAAVDKNEAERALADGTLAIQIAEDAGNCYKCAVVIDDSDSDAATMIADVGERLLVKARTLAPLPAPMPMPPMPMPEPPPAPMPA